MVTLKSTRVPLVFTEKVHLPCSVGVNPIQTRGGRGAIVPALTWTFIPFLISKPKAPYLVTFLKIYHSNNRNNLA